MSKTGFSEPTTVPVVLGVGPTALGVMRCLSRGGLRPFLVARSGDLAVLSRWTGRRRLLLEEPGSAEDVLALPRRLRADRVVVIPCTDEWTKIVSGLLPQETILGSVASREIVDSLIDKLAFAETLARFDVPAPRTTPVRSDADLEGALEGTFLKPRQSQLFAQHYHRKAFTFENAAEAERGLGLMTEVGLDAVLQEYVPGPPTAHYFIDGFARSDGSIAALFARRRLRMYPLDFGNSTLMVSVPLDEVRQAADDLVRLLTGIGYRGVFSAEFKLDERDGVFKILEVNSRPWWFVEYASLCGVDVSVMAYRCALGLPVDDVRSYEVGVRGIFLPQDILAFRALHRTGELSTIAWLRSIAGAKATLFAWRDPLPGVALPLIYLRARHRRLRTA
jgi:D-aspartate ligase